MHLSADVTLPSYSELGNHGNSLDGNQWLMLDEGSKYAFIAGFLDGLFQGHCFTTWGLPGTEHDDPAYLNAVKSFRGYWTEFIVGRTYRQFYCGLDLFYADDKNRGIEIKSGIWIVMNELSDGENLHSMIEAWRRKAAGNT